MIVSYDFNRNISPYAVAVALGIDPEGASVRVDKSSQEVTWEFPGEIELTAEQHSALRYISETMMTGTEKQAGWLDTLLSNTDPVIAKRAALVALLTEPSNYPMPSAIRMVAYLTTLSINYTRANPTTAPQESFENVIAGAVGFVQSGGADDL